MAEDWRTEGEAPDYRFTLANERTFLAWIRTALALMAGAIAIDQLAPDIAPAPLRIALCVILALLGALLGIVAYRRWAKQEHAMRLGRPLPGTRLLIGITVAIAIAAATLAILFVVP